MKLIPQDHQLTGFAEACFDTNSVQELIEALLEQSADKEDCKQWGITPIQWRESIKRALECRLYQMEDTTGELSKLAAILGRKGGSVKSERKAAASRENGKKGGKPKKKE